MPQAQHIEVFIYNTTLTVLSAIKWANSLFPLSEEKTNQGTEKLSSLPQTTQLQAAEPEFEPHPVGQHVLWEQRKGDDQFSSVTQLFLTLCDPMNRSTPGLPVHHQLPESTQTHVH